MKKFETPAIEVVNFAVEDIITTSVVTPGGNNCPTQLPAIPDE